MSRFYHSSILIAAAFLSMDAGAVTWNTETCEVTSPGVIAGMANPELACCMRGWSEPGAGNSKLDCTETPATLTTFDQLYNYTPDATYIDSDGVDRPYRVYIRDTTTPDGSATGTPIPGFYNPSTGLRCAYNGGPKTVAEQFDLFDLAAKTHAVPPGVPSNCTRLIRTAMATLCPPLPTSGTPVWTNVDSKNKRCSFAASITFHISVVDLIDAGAAHRTQYHEVSSYPPAALDAGTKTDYFQTNPIFYWRFLEKLTPGACGTDAAGLPAPGGTSTSPGLKYDTDKNRCFIL